MANPESIIHSATRRAIQLKAHRCLWSGVYPENSEPAIAECLRESVARAEIDLHMLRDGDFLVFHDPDLDGTTTATGPVAALTRRESQAVRLVWGGTVTAERPPLFSEIVALLRDSPAPTVLELDLVTFAPMPWDRVEELVRLIAPVRDRVVLNGYDWNVRRAATVDPTLPVAYDPQLYLDWVPESEREGTRGQLPEGAYGYLDAHPLAQQRLTSTPDYLRLRLDSLARLVPGAREIHLRLAAFERMLDDGLADAAEIFHRQGLRLDVWTLNADTPQWRKRLRRALAAGVDMITSDTPRALAAAAQGED